MASLQLPIKSLALPPQSPASGSAGAPRRLNRTTIKYYSSMMQSTPDSANCSPHMYHLPCIHPEIDVYLLHWHLCLYLFTQPIPVHHHSQNHCIPSPCCLFGIQSASQTPRHPSIVCPLDPGHRSKSDPPLQTLSFKTSSIGGDPLSSCTFRTPCTLQNSTPLLLPFTCMVSPWWTFKHLICKNAQVHWALPQLSPAHLGWPWVHNPLVQFVFSLFLFKAPPL